jgi:hypothetical protein
MTPLSPEDRALIEAGARGDLPDAGARERMRTRLGARLGAAAGLGAATLVTRTATASGTTTLIAKILGSAAIVGALGVAVVKLAPVDDRTPAVSASPARSAESAPRVVARGTAESQAAPPLSSPATSVETALAEGRVDEPVAPASPRVAPASPLAEEPVAPASPRVASASPPIRQARVAAPPASEGASLPEATELQPAPVRDAPAPTRGALAEETRLLREADAATRAGEPARALSLLAEHARRFPQGVLAEERDVERLLALCAAGRTEEARTAAAELLQTRPRSPLAGRVRGSCGGGG